MDKKYELTDETITLKCSDDRKDRIFYRIKALRDIYTFGGWVRTGELGGFVGSEKNLSQEGSSWIFNDAKVGDNALVSGEATIYNSASIGGNAHVFGDASVYDRAHVFGNAQVYGETTLLGYSHIRGDAEITNNWDWFYLSGLSENCGSSDYLSSSITVYRDHKLGVAVHCQGLYYGVRTLEEFEQKFVSKYETGKYFREYMKLLELIKIHFGIDNTKSNKDLKEEI